MAPCHSWCDCRNRSLLPMPLRLAELFWIQSQSYQIVSRETFWYDWGQKPYKRVYIARVCDRRDRPENWYFGRAAGAAARAAGIGMATIAVLALTSESSKLSKP
jgi:hypothetical protein